MCVIRVKYLLEKDSDLFAGVIARGKALGSHCVLEERGLCRKTGNQFIRHFFVSTSGDCVFGPLAGGARLKGRI